MWTLLHLALVGVVFLIRDTVLDWSFTSLARLVAFTSAAIMVQTIATAPRRLWSPSSVLFLIFFLFHCGLAVALSFGPLPGESLDLKYWFWHNETKAALWLVLLGMVAYGAGVNLSRAIAAATRTRPKLEEAIDLDNDTVALIGAALTSFAVVLWFVNALATGGVGILVGSYRDFLDTANGNNTLVAYYSMDAGLILTAATTWTRWHRFAWGAFALFALVGFPIGLRGEVLFPLAAAAAVASARGFGLSTGRALVLAIVLLAGISVARQMRQVGLGSLEPSHLSADPRDGLIEMGISLRPVQQVVIWHDQGEDFAHGATYWAPVDRMLYYFIPGWTRPPIALDDRMMSVVIAERAGPIGFSIVAESYHNFASEGVLFILLGVGFLFGRIDTWPSSRRRQIWVGTLLLAALSHVRNPFVGIPITILVGSVVNITAMFLGRVVADEHRQTRSTPSA
jgi:hypothetical protein